MASNTKKKSNQVNNEDKDQAKPNNVHSKRRKKTGKGEELPTQIPNITKNPSKEKKGKMKYKDKS